MLDLQCLIDAARQVVETCRKQTDGWGPPDDDPDGFYADIDQLAHSLGQPPVFYTNEGRPNPNV